MNGHQTLGVQKDDPTKIENIYLIKRNTQLTAQGKQIKAENPFVVK